MCGSLERRSLLIGDNRRSELSKPFVVSSTFRVREGRSEALREYYQRAIRLFEAEEPRLIGFYVFINEDETEVTNIQIHPDAKSMEFHMNVLRDNWEKTFSRYGENVEGIRVECFGDTPQSVLDLQVVGGPEYILKPGYVGGFTRITNT